MNDKYSDKYTIAYDRLENMYQYNYNNTFIH